MSRLVVVLLAACFSLLGPAQSAAQKQQQSDADIKKAIIADSISRYSGNCPCPYNTARNGSRCGKRSAYSKPGGASPICYETDVTPEMVKTWKERRKQ